MEPERIYALVLFGILHWVLVIVLLNDLTHRKVLGGHKAPWAIAIIFIIFLGSMLYMLFHPRFFIDSGNKDE